MFSLCLIGLGLPQLRAVNKSQKDICELKSGGGSEWGGGGERRVSTILEIRVFDDPEEVSDGK